MIKLVVSLYKVAGFAFKRRQCYQDKETNTSSQEGKGLCGGCQTDYKYKCDKMLILIDVILMCITNAILPWDVYYLKSSCHIFRNHRTANHFEGGTTWPHHQSGTKIPGRSQGTQLATLKNMFEMVGLWAMLKRTLKMLKKRWVPAQTIHDSRSRPFF